MKTKAAAVQGGLAALGLIAAYTTWQREPDRPAGEVVVMDVGKNDLQKVRFDDGTKWVELTETKESGEPVVYMKLAANAQTKTPERELRGNDGAVKLWDKFTPLRGSRALGNLAADKLKELGLDAAKKHIEVTVRGEKRVLDVGASPFGVSDPYVKTSDGKVYVLGGSVVSDLESAAVRLVERALHGFKPQEWDALVVSAGGKKRELQQINPEQPMAAKLASKKTPTKPDEMAKNWHDKLWRSFAAELLGRGEQPAAGAPQIALRVDYSSGGKPKGWIEIGRVTPQPAAPLNTSAPPPAAELYARTEHTAGWVKLPPAAEDLLKEAEKLAAAE
ncbi:MAG TPA: hypothetical protein VFF06_28845 [Polyangia bacterium]|nr:hypothetical protein [Polyangia bacterium]